MSVGEARVDGNGDTAGFFRGSSGLTVDEFRRHGTLIGLQVAICIGYSSIQLKCFAS